MRRSRQILLGTALSLLGGGSALADGIILDGVSAYTIGRGGTNLGFADNGSILHDNPAAMGQIESDGLTLCYLLSAAIAAAEQCIQ